MSLGFLFTETSRSPPALFPGLLQISEFFAWSLCLVGFVEGVSLLAELAGAGPSSWPVCPGMSFAGADCARLAVTLALLPMVLALSSTERLGPRRLPLCLFTSSAHGSLCQYLVVVCVQSGF